MSNSPQLQPVLDRIDADFDNSLERLFALLRIKSISADPAFAADCKTAADHLAKDIATLGFDAEVRATAGHPAIVAKSAVKSNGNGKAAGIAIDTYAMGCCIGDYDNDGWVDLFVSGYGRSVLLHNERGPDGQSRMVRFCTASEKLAGQVQMLLNRLGILAWIQVRPGDIRTM